jgi:hypothetical protein
VNVKHGPGRRAESRSSTTTTSIRGSSNRVIEYRNLEEEKSKDAPASEDAEAERPLDEYGEEIIDRKIFDSLAKLSEVEATRISPARSRRA